MIETIETQDTHTDLSFLLESTYPLLKYLRERAPGTHKHSQSVASMVEAVSVSIGLEVTVMKICALYHDVGKTCNPVFFTENQIEEDNPHDEIEPWMSYQLISRHVPDSVNMLINNPDFPRKIIEIISQHHGNSIIKSFFDKAGKTASSESYRYQCSKPTSIESAVLMISDHVEATSKSRFQAGKLNTIDIIDSTITNLLDDGQLDGVVMKLGDLKKIKLAIAKDLEGSYHKRVQYPSDTREEND